MKANIYMNRVILILIHIYIIFLSGGAAAQQEKESKSLVSEIIIGYQKCKGNLINLDFARLSGDLDKLSVDLDKYSGKKLGTPYNSKSNNDYIQVIDSIVECSENLTKRTDLAFKNDVKKNPNQLAELTDLKTKSDRLSNLLANTPTTNTDLNWNSYKEEVRRQLGPVRRSALILANPTEEISINISLK